MIKVLRKSFDIITYIASRQGESVLPGEIVRALGLNQPTTIRILKDLVETGYLEQVSSRQGYSLGPLAYWVTHGKVYMDELSKAADPLINECAKAAGESVLLAVLNGCRRHILIHYNYNTDIAVEITQPFYEDIYQTATGRVLLAFCERRHQSSIIKNCGMPKTGEWDEVADMPGMKKYLEQIRRRGYEKSRNDKYHIAAFPVFRNNEFTAALGISVPPGTVTPEKLEDKFSRAALTARLITEKISTQSITPG
ncbi:MAG: helix-turn-helix domain-containing protein [Victivallales bacterium]|nr:helix-turn-helix domain-containing protein [Victivallales bacterium]